MIVGGLHLDHAPAAAAKRRDVFLPLAQRKISVDGRAPQVRQLAGREVRRGTADEDARAHRPGAVPALIEVASRSAVLTTQTWIVRRRPLAHRLARESRPSW